MRAFFHSQWFLMILLATPLSLLTFRFFFSPLSQEAYEKLMHSTGELGTRLLIVALLITPLRLMFPANRFWRWMLRHRKHIGMFSFLYGFLHLSVYLCYHYDLKKIGADLLVPRYLLGWVAFILLVPLALTSSQQAIKTLGFRTWKRLHRLVYVVALCAFFHWLWKDNQITIPALVHFVPLALFELYRVYKCRPSAPSSDTNKLVTTDRPNR